MEANRRFLFKLCLNLGYKSVSELENSLSANELIEWYEYYKEEQFMADRLELQIATLSAMVYSSSGGKDLSAVDFMISVDDETKEKQRAKEKHAKIVKALDAFGT